MKKVLYIGIVLLFSVCAQAQNRIVNKVSVDSLDRAFKSVINRITYKQQNSVYSGNTSQDISELVYLADAYFKINYLDRAEICYKRILDIVENVTSENYEMCAHSYVNLSAIYKKKKDYLSELEMLSNAYCIYLDYGDAKNEVICLQLDNLISMAFSNRVQAPPVGISPNGHNPVNFKSNLISSIKKGADYCKYSRDYKAAEVLFKSSLNINKSLCGANLSDEVVDSYYDVIDLYLTIGEYVKAVQSAEEVIKACNKDGRMKYVYKIKKLIGRLAHNLYENKQYKNGLSYAKMYAERCIKEAELAGYKQNQKELAKTSCLLLKSYYEKIMQGASYTGALDKEYYDFLKANKQYLQ